MSEAIRIYVADLAAYNNGTLHGVWINATDDLDDIRDEINQMLKESPEEDAEEYALHDYEGFGGYSVAEYEGIETAHNIACFISDYPDFAGELLDYYDIEEARNVAEEQYCGCYASLADYAESFTDETSDVPEHLAFYIDYDRMGRDWELSGDIFTIETAHDEIHVFWAH